jgi:hypothetical protein
VLGSNGTEICLRLAGDELPVEHRRSFGRVARSRTDDELESWTTDRRTYLLEFTSTSLLKPVFCSIAPQRPSAAGESGFEMELSMPALRHHLGHLAWRQRSWRGWEERTPIENSAAKRAWARLIEQASEVDPLVSPRCAGPMRLIEFIEQREAVDLPVPGTCLRADTHRQAADRADPDVSRPLARPSSQAACRGVPSAVRPAMGRAA